jgi:hypothetical protein
MQEYYINKNGQKRRLKFNTGDIILCDNEGELLPYMVMKNSYYNDKFGLTCLLCTKPVAATEFSKKELQELLYSMHPYDVIDRKQLKEFLIGQCVGKKVSNCI